MNPAIDKLRQENRRKAELQAQADQNQAIVQGLQSLDQNNVQAISALVRFLQGHTSKTEVVNQLKEIGTPDAFKVMSAVNDMHSTLKKLKNADFSEVVDRLNKLIEVSSKEIEIPEQREEVRVSNLNELSSEISSLEQAIDRLANKKQPDIKVASPVVNVDAPIVNVEQDFATLQKGLKDVVEAIRKQVFPEPIATDITPLVDEQKKSNKLLKEIAEKRVGGSGSGGHTTPYQDADGKPVYVELQGGAVPITGSITASASTLADFSVNDIEEDTTSYFGYTKPDGTWLVKSLTATSVSYATETNNVLVTSYTDAWTDRATLTYQRFDEAF